MKQTNQKIEKSMCEKRGFHTSNQFDSKYHNYFGYDKTCMDCGEILEHINKMEEKNNTQDRCPKCGGTYSHNHWKSQEMEER